jgi:hypothetical protein
MSMKKRKVLGRPYEVSGILFKMFKKFYERRSFILSKLLFHFPESSSSPVYDIIRDRIAYNKFCQDGFQECSRMLTKRRE